MKKIFALCFLAFFVFATPAFANYIYAYSLGEYSITLPGAPRGKTIWSHDSEIPLLEKGTYPQGRVGETATFKRLGITNDDFIDVKIITVQAKNDTLAALDENKMEALGLTELKNVKTDVPQIFFSSSAKDPTRKAIRIIADSVSKDEQPILHHIQVMTGKNTLTLVHIIYSKENAAFQKEYENIIASIKFIGQ